MMFIKNKRGMSGVIITLLIILLAIVLVAIVWGVISNMAKKGTERSQTCFDVFDKIELNPSYTCWNESDKNFTFSISIKDIDVDSIVVRISSRALTKAFTIPGTYEDLGPYGESLNTEVTLPGKNEGKTYYTNAFASTGKPDSIEVLAVIDGNQCEVSDKITEIGNC